MNEHQIKLIIKLKKYLKIIHHSKGRIRFDIDFAIKKDKEILNSDLDLKINGIKEVKINKILGKLTINYDYQIIKDDDIKALFSSDDDEFIYSLIKKYQNN